MATKDSNSWPLKIMYYADLRTLLLSIGTLEERLADIRHRLLKYAARADFENLVEACRDIEKQIQEKVNVPLKQISEESVKMDQVLLEKEMK